MKCSNKIFWIFVVIVAATAIFDRGNCAKLYILEENSINKVTPSRLRRQTHPASTIAKLPTQDNNVFTPIVGPTQSSDQQFRQNNLEFSNSDTLVDYLLPPNPNAQFTSLNFQDPSANLQNIDSFFDVAPTSSSSDQVNSFQPIQNQFTSSGGSFSNQISITAPNPTVDSVQSISFHHNSPPPPSPPSLTFSSLQQPSVNHFIQNKESSSLSRELNSVNNFKSFNQFKPSSNFVKSEPIVNSNFIKSDPIVSSNFIKSDPIVSSNFIKSDPIVSSNFIKSDPTVSSNFVKSDSISLDQSNQGKWDLGFDANDILVPPNLETARTTEYDTINGNKHKKLNNVPPPLNILGPPSTALPANNLPPPSNNFITPSNSLSPPSNQFNSGNQFVQSNQFSQPNNQFQSNNQFFPNQFTSQQNNFNQFNPSQTSLNNQFIPSNAPFTQQNPVPASNNQISVPSQISPNNEHSEIVWGTQKQTSNFIQTTAAPFLPTIPPTSNSNQNSFNYQQNGFNNGQNLQQFPSTQLNSDQIYQFPGNVNNHNHNQNYALDTPHTSQFDSFLPQGTVSDHSFFPGNDNNRHFQHKRQVEDEDELEEEVEVEEVEEPVYKSKSKFKTGPVYSFVKTDKNGHFKWSVRHPSRR